MRRTALSRLLPQGYLLKLLAFLPVFVVCYEGVAVVATALLRLDPGRAAIGFGSIGLATWMGLVAICMVRSNPANSDEGNARRFAAAMTLTVAFCLVAIVFCSRYADIMPEIFGLSGVVAAALALAGIYPYTYWLDLRMIRARERPHAPGGRT